MLACVPASRSSEISSRPCAIRASLSSRQIRLSSDGSTSTYSYDSNGDLDSQTLASASTTYSYDSIGQMTGLQNSSATMSEQYSGDGLEVGSESGQAWQQADPVEGSYGLSGVSCPTTSIEAIVPIPRGPMISPAVTTG